MAGLPKKILLHNPLSPGDVVVCTALGRDIKRTFPEVELGYVGVSPEAWMHNPYIRPMNENEGDVFKYRTHYSLIHKSNQNRFHFLWGYHRDFNKQLQKWGVDREIKLTEFKPDLHLSDAEMKNPLVSGKYWVICAGGKFDYTAKWWDPHKWQRVVDMLKDEVTFVQVGGASHFHPKLNGVVNMIGKTNFRELITLCAHADGVLCVVTCLMHIAAGVNRPCVVVAGGREPWWWEAYTKLNRNENMRMIHGKEWMPPDPDPMVEHAFLHTIGRYNLDCCSNHGCWKSKVEGGGSTCRHPCKGPSIMQPKCLMYIEPEMVVSAIRLYTRTGLNQQNTTLPKEVLAMKPTEIVEVKMELDEQVMEPPVSINLLCYGPFHDLHKRCIQSIMDNTPKGKYELRVAMNEVCQETREWVNGSVHKELGGQLVVYDSPENIMKYPMMRRMFFDQARPQRKWIIWFDDDSYVTEDDWLMQLSRSIRDNWPKGHVMWGKRYFWHLRGNQEQWGKAADWWKGKPFQVDHTHGNRLKIDFATGGFWAIPSKWIIKLNWPDVRLYHNGGDVWMGEAVRQFGGNIKNYEYGVAISKAKRRGFRENAAGVYMDKNAPLDAQAQNG